MKVSFAAAAEYELTAAVNHYNEQLDGLGFGFGAEVKKSVTLIEAHPNGWPKLSERWRRHRVRRFPYGLVYRSEDPGDHNRRCHASSPGPETLD